jgi:Xaa-Pro aminopeptidase
VLVGRDPVRARVAHDCRRLLDELVAACRPGMAASELHAVAAERIERDGYELLDLLANIGHSQGSEFAGDGFIDAGNDTPMWGGWAVEPHIGRDGVGAKFEEIVWFGPDGCSVVAA